MALNFPANPIVDDTFTDGDTTWRWNGTAWIVDAGVAATPNSFTTFVADTGTTTANTTADTMTVTGGSEIETEISGDEITINFVGNIPLATNSFATVNSDAGNVTATSPTDTITIAGGTNVDTAVSGSTLTINATVPTPVLSINDLTDVDTFDTQPTTGDVLKWDGAKWAPGTDVAEGGAGLDATTLSGFSGSYYLNYNNLNNKPTIPADVSDLTDTTNIIPVNIEDLSNVAATVPATGQTLVWNGAAWTPDTVSGGGGDPDQNLFETIRGDVGSIVAETTTDSITIAGGTLISTTADGTTGRLTVSFTGTLGVSKYDDLEEVQRTGRTIDKSYMPAIAMLRMNNVGNTAYSCDSHGYTGNNPSLYALGGTTIAFDLDGIGGHPFQIEDGTGTPYNTGLVHVDIIGNVSTGADAQGKDGGTLYWEVPETISGTYRYQCTLHPAMVGAIIVKRLSVI